MRTVLAALGVLCFMGSCSSGMTSSKGIVCDATMNTVAIVTDKNDTLSFSTMNANKEEVDGTYSGAYPFTFRQLIRV